MTDYGTWLFTFHHNRILMNLSTGDEPQKGSLLLHVGSPDSLCLFLIPLQISSQCVFTCVFTLKGCSVCMLWKGLENITQTLERTTCLALIILFFNRLHGVTSLPTEAWMSNKSLHLQSLHDLSHLERLPLLTSCCLCVCVCVCEASGTACERD